MKPRRNYFTQSQSLLPALHPPSEFHHLIQTKKEYHSLIKQELQALDQLENEQKHERSEKEKQATVPPFTIEEVTTEIPLVQKTSGEVALSYERLLQAKLGKEFARLLRGMSENRTKSVMGRASQYFHRNSLAEKYFKLWKKEVSIELPTAASVRQREMVAGVRRMAAWKEFRREVEMDVARGRLGEVVKGWAMRRVWGSLRSAILQRHRKAELIQKLQCATLLPAVTSLKSHLSTRRRQESLLNSTKLLTNIRCHRKINTFFTICKQLQFAHQRKHIIHSLLQKINLTPLLTRNDSGNAAHPSTTLNAQLLNLILQNFIQQYAQEYSLQLGEEQLGLFLRAMKMQCLGRLLQDHSKAAFLTKLKYNHQENIKMREIQTMIIRASLDTMRIHLDETIKIQATTSMLKCQNLIFLIQETQSLKKLTQSLSKLQKKQISKRYLQKTALSSLKAALLDSKTLRFKKNLAFQWNNTRLLKKTLASWSLLKTLRPSETSHDTSHATSTPHKPIHPPLVQSEKLLRKFDSFSSPAQSEDKADPFANNERINKTKMQLSKIVSEINRGMVKMQEGYRGSSVRMEGKKATVTSLKAQSDQVEPVFEEEDAEEEQHGGEVETLRKKQVLTEIVGLLRRNKDMQRGREQLLAMRRKMRFVQFVGVGQRERAEEKRMHQLHGQIIRNKQILLLQSLQNLKEESAKSQKFLNHLHSTRTKTVFQALIILHNNNTHLRESILSIQSLSKQTMQKSLINRLKINHNRQLIQHQISKLIHRGEERIIAEGLSNWREVCEVNRKAKLVQKQRTMRCKRLFMQQLATPSQSDSKQQERQEDNSIALPIPSPTKSPSQLSHSQRSLSKSELDLPQSIHSSDSELILNNYLHEQQQTSGKKYPLFSPLRPQEQVLKQYREYTTERKGLQGYDAKEDGEKEELSYVSNSELERHQLLQNFLADDDDDDEGEGESQGKGETGKKGKKGLDAELVDSEEEESYEMEDRIKPYREKILDSLEKLPQQSYLQHESDHDMHESDFEPEEQAGNSSEQNDSPYAHLARQTQISRRKHASKQLLSSLTHLHRCKSLRKHQQNTHIRTFTTLLRAITSSKTLCLSLKRSHFNSFTYFCQKVQNNRLRLEQQKQTLAYSQQHYERTLKRGVFAAFTALRETNYLNNLRVKCFQGWKLFHNQKRLLKKYLQMQEEESQHSLSYYPASLHQRDQFRQLQ